MAEKLEMSLVHQRRGLQRMIGSLLAEMPLSDTVQCGIHYIHQFRARGFVSVAQLPEQFSDVGGSNLFGPAIQGEGDESQSRGRSPECGLYVECSCFAGAHPTQCGPYSRRHPVGSGASE